MRKISLIFMFLALCSGSRATFVPSEEARTIAAQFYRSHHPGLTGSITCVEESCYRYSDKPVIYRFSFGGNGFILIAADDASIPVIGYSFENSFTAGDENPAVQSWINSRVAEINKIIENHLDNDQTLKIWNSIKSGTILKSATDVNPLLTTTWDQGCYYDAQCPADASAFFSCGHVYVGCVATAMAQVMKYHNFPPQGVGSHSYTHPTYGQQTANFGSTTYNWSSMPNNVTANNAAVATISYHAGVAVNMQYATSGSGAYTSDVPDALMNYFNYAPGIFLAAKNNYPNTEDFKNLIRADLDQNLPVYYSGYGSGGHAWVCDGYRMSDGTFHFNWGWSGSSNGWYAIGALNPGGNSFNEDNQAVLHVRPGNPNLIVRIPHPVNNAVIGVGYTVEIQGVTVKGIPEKMKLFIDGVEKYSVANDTLNFTWSTSAADLGSHDVKMYAINATDTVFYQINLNVAEWISQATGFTTPSRGINYMSAVDSNIVWATAFDNVNPTGACSDFTKTVNGGQTWIPGVITNTTGLAGSMIFAIDSNTAYVPMYKVSGNKPMGVYVTHDGGATWSRQTTASFSNSASFPNCIHFFTPSEGWCMGDPINGDFEIYTTSNGGTTWTQVAGASLPNPLSGEYGVVGYYSAVHDTIWFGTNLGRIYKSTDKGLTYTVTTVPALSGKYIKPTFRNGQHGLAQDKSAGTTGMICETFDGGSTWTQVNATGTIFATDISYVPNTTKTWVSSGSSGNMGSSYSFDGGHSWTQFVGTNGAAYMQMSWVNNHCGWAGGVNTTATENGAYRFIGLLRPPLPAPTNLQAVVTNHDVHLTWNAPASNPSGYNMYRNGMKLNSAPIVALVYDDQNVVSGQYTYCVKALYPDGESEGACTVVDVAVGQDRLTRNPVRIYPNPASDHITVEGNISGRYELLDVLGNVTGSGIVKKKSDDRYDIFTGNLEPGIYFLHCQATGKSYRIIISDKH